jgi:aspartyl protease family protein
MARYSTHKPLKRGFGFKHVLFLFGVLCFIIFSANAFLTKIQALKTANSPAIKANPHDLITGGIILRADAAGHFRGTALINGYSMPFVIDTGATHTIIPAKLAAASGLPVGRTIQTETAGGKVFDQLTHIDSLKIGTAEISNLNASINQHLDEVLIGMSTLRYFHITQDINTLTLVAFTKPEEIAEIEKSLTVPPPAQPRWVAQPEPSFYQAPMSPPQTNQPPKNARTTWTKSVTCNDARCTTSYK